MRQLALKLVLLAISSGICVLVANRVLLAIAKTNYQAEHDAWDNPQYELVDPPLYVQLREAKNVESVVKAPDGSETRWHYSVNADHLRGPTIDTDSISPGTRRILFLGDSYTFGWCVEYVETFVSGLNARFAKASLGVECINAGAPGYNTEQEYGNLLRLYDRFKPHAVVLAYVTNDAQAITIGPRSPDYTYRYATCALLEEAKILGNWLSYAVIRDEPLLATRVLLGASEYHESFAPHASGWRESRRFLGKIHSFCQEKGILLHVFVLPDFTQPFDSRYALLFIHDAVERWGNELGFLVDDLLPYFLGRDNSTLSVPGDGHPNPNGHELMATAMFPILRSRLAR